MSREERGDIVGRETVRGVAGATGHSGRLQEAVEDALLGGLDDRGEEGIEVVRLKRRHGRCRAAGSPQSGRGGEEDLAAAVVSRRTRAGEAEAGAAGESRAAGRVDRRVGEDDDDARPRWWRRLRVVGRRAGAGARRARRRL